MIQNLFFTFLKIGMFSIGGGYAIIPLIQEQVVAREGWITENVFTDIITISQMTPGPLAVNTSTFVGMQVAGTGGAIAATLGCILCGAIISLVLYSVFRRNRSECVLRILSGLKAASLGLIMSAGFTIILLTLWNSSDYKSVDFIKDIDVKSAVLFAGLIFCFRKWKASPVPMMLVSGVAGLMFLMIK